MTNANTRKEENAGGLLIDLHYLPCIDYFTHLIGYETITLEGAGHYQKQTYRNRCRVLTAQKVITLSVPVCKAGRRQLIREVKIDYGQGWLKDHWRTIASAYGKAPFFPDYAPFLEKTLLKKHTYLFDLNFELLTNCLFLLGIRKNIDITSVYQETPRGSVKDLRNAVCVKDEAFTGGAQGIASYRQMFGSNFVPGLSIVDLLFCQGPAALNTIRQSIFL